ncbi:MAG TPA: hypothetical protein VIR27_08370 [Mycobacteriales bacterium]
MTETDWTSDRLVADLAGLAETLAEAPVEVLARAVLAVAVVHQLDRRGRCQTCRPRRRWWGSVAETCPTRELLRVAAWEARVPRWRSA